MNVLSRIRRHSGTFSRVNLALFGLVWLSIVIAPCTMAMQIDAMHAHDCPHCTHGNCEQVEPRDCDAPDSLDSLRTVDKTESIALLPPRLIESALQGIAGDAQALPVALPPARAGPRPHLIFVQFNE